MKAKIRVLAIVIFLALGAAACGDSRDSGETAPTEVPLPTGVTATQVPASGQPTESTAPTPASDLPSVDLVNVDTGATVNLAGFAPSDQPLVLWFWAPH